MNKHFKLSNILNRIRSIGNITIRWIKQRKLQDYIMYGFYCIIALSVINISVMLVHFLDDDYEFPVFSYSYIDAIPPGQDLEETISTDIVRIKEIHLEDLSKGDQIVIFGDYGISENWIEEVVSVDYITNQVELTYDQVSSQTVQFDSVYGEYVKEANIFGTMYFTAKFNQGFLLLFMSHAFVISAYYFGLVSKELEKKNE